MKNREFLDREQVFNVLESVYESCCCLTDFTTLEEIQQRRMVLNRIVKNIISLPIMHEAHHE